MSAYPYCDWDWKQTELKKYEVSIAELEYIP